MHRTQRSLRLRQPIVLAIAIKFALHDPLQARGLLLEALAEAFVTHDCYEASRNGTSCLDLDSQYFRLQAGEFAETLVERN